MIFSFSGEYITQHARNLMICGEHDFAHEYIKDVCPELKGHQIKAVLDGTYCLKGKEVLDFIKEEQKITQDYLKELNPAPENNITNSPIVVKINNLEKNHILNHIKSMRIAHQKDDINIEQKEKSLKEQILQQIKNNNGSWETFEYIDDISHMPKKLQYPIELGLAFALEKTNAASLAPSWKTVSPKDLKTENDNPLHSDLWLALGYKLGKSVYDSYSPEHRAFNQLICHIQEKHLGYEMHVLSSANKKAIHGVFRHPETWDARAENENTILVIPHLGIEYEQYFLQAKGVVCSQGGRLAHLAIVGRELNIPIVRHENALEKCLTGLSGNINFEEGKINVIPLLKNDVNSSAKIKLKVNI